jgi:hypothetical protein
MKIQSFLKDGFFAWTLTNNGYKYITWNLAESWKRAGCSARLCVVCADKPSYQFLTREGVSCVLMETLLPDFGTQVVPFGSKQFSQLNRIKLKLLHTFAQNPEIQQCLYLDGDIAVYKDIVADIRAKLAVAQFWAPCDEQPAECTRGDGPCKNVCTGFLAWNHGADKGCFEITDSAVWQANPEDQLWVNYSVKERGIEVSVLPRDEYPNGARLTLTKQTPDLREKAMCLHYNYRVGESKIYDMKRFRDWLLVY